MHLPMVRMTNTIVLDGPDDPDDIVRSTDHGVYVANLGGGSVNTATGDFVFGMREAYLIENGEITEPLREGNLIGNGPQVLRDIDMLAGDFAMGNPGTCGKDGQGVPVGDGQPTLRVKSLTIGGTAPMSDLLEIADRVIAQAAPGEQVEAYVSRGDETEIRVYGGDVEHFVAARSEGIGIRVIRDGRTGFAYAGTLDGDGDRRGAGRGPRQRRVRHGRRMGRPRRARRRADDRAVALERRPRRVRRPTARSTSPRSSRSSPRASIRGCGSTRPTTPTDRARRPWRRRRGSVSTAARTGAT